MGCTSDFSYESQVSYRLCTMTINNLTDELIKVYPLKHNRLLVISCKNFKILDFKFESELESTDFGEEIFSTALLIKPREKIVQGTCSGNLTVTDMATKESIKLPGHLSTIMVLLVLRDGNFLSASSDGLVYVWDSIKLLEIVHFKAHKAPIWSICELKNKNLITTCDNGESKMINWKNKPGSRVLLVFNTPGCKCLAQMHDKRIVYNSDRDLIIYNLDNIPDVSEDIPEIRKKKLHEPDFHLEEIYIKAISYILPIRTGEILVGFEDGLIKIYHSGFGMLCVYELTGHRERINFISEYPDQRLVTCGDDKKIKFWIRGETAEDNYY